MRITHYWAPLFEDPAGVSAAIADWSGHQAEAGHQVTLLGDGDPARAGQVYPTTVTVRGLRHRGRSRVARIPAGLAAELRTTDLLVLHEGYTAHQYVAALSARRLRVPYVVMPHGVENASWRAMMRFPRTRQSLERPYLRHAAAVHLFFASEEDVVRAVSPKVRTIVLPTGTEVPERTWNPGSELLWIGRYSVQHKGLDLLLRALADVPSAQRPRVRLRGFDYAGGKAELTALRDSLGLHDHVTIGEPVRDPAEKDELLRTCAGWIQPSRWESHSISLLEALSRGVPALISDRMPVSSELRAADAALVTGLHHDALVRALTEFAHPDPALGARGRAYACAHFDWAAVMARHDVEYADLVARSARAHR